MFCHGIALSQAALAKLLSCGLVLPQVLSAVGCTCSHTMEKGVCLSIPGERNIPPLAECVFIC